MSGAELALAAAAVGAVGSISQGIAANNAAKFNAAMHEQNAVLARDAAAQQEDDFRRDARRAMGTQAVALGVSGVSASEGTPLDLAAASASEAELTARRIRFAGEVDARRETASAGLARSDGAAAFRAGLFKSGSTLLTGGYYFRRAGGKFP